MTALSLNAALDKYLVRHHQTRCEMQNAYRTIRKDALAALPGMRATTV